MKNCYVLFVKTGKEEIIVDKLKLRLDSNLYLPFVPTKEKFFRKGGRTTKEIQLGFPGYAFIESKLFSDEFIIETKSFIRMFKDIYKIVNYGDKTNIALRENERLFLNELCGNNYCIKSSSGFVEGNSIRIKKDPLIGIKSLIKKVNSHKREAIIEIEFMGCLRQICVGLEIVEKI